MTDLKNMSDYNKNWNFYRELGKMAHARQLYLMRSSRSDLAGSEQKIEGMKKEYEARLNDFVGFCKGIEFCPLEHGTYDDIQGWMEDHYSDKDDCRRLYDRATTLESKASTYPGYPAYYRKTLENVLPERKTVAEETVVEIAVEVEATGVAPAFGT